MKVVAITGAGGFIGRCLVDLLSQSATWEVRALYRRASLAPRHLPRFVVVEGDVSDPGALSKLLRPGCSVVHCAYDDQATRAHNLSATSTLARACVEHHVKRVVHCSTALVVGRAASGRVDEMTVPRPQTDYEQTKLAVEAIFANEARGGFDLVILRPTAVFGPGGRNLLRLVDRLARGGRMRSYLLSCVNDRRRMNLVGIGNVVAAIAFLLEETRRFEGEVFIVSDDEAVANNYRDVELGLMRDLDISDYGLPRIRLSPQLLAALLKLSGRAITDPDTTFVCDKLLQTGFRKPWTFDASLAAFAKAYRAADGRSR